jgi:hypothetical protein
MSKFITHLFYKGDTLKPTLQFSDEQDYSPVGKTISLSFDLSERFCIGWHDMSTGENHACPEMAQTDKKFATCVICQKRTGFNPAFYHANKVSAKQEARNAEPHHLYLAYMGKNYIKVGISWHKRDTRRLLDQGARAGLILETFPTALIARQYEAKIAHIEGIHETTATRTKLALINEPFDETTATDQLLGAKQRIQELLGTSFTGTDIQLFDRFYTQRGLFTGPITPLTDSKISGLAEALIGDILITRYDDRLLALPLKQYIGYPIALSEEMMQLDLAPQQMQLL